MAPNIVDVHNQGQWSHTTVTGGESLTLQTTPVTGEYAWGGTNISLAVLPFLPLLRKYLFDLVFPDNINVLSTCY